MKSFSHTLALLIALALAGCGWNPFHKMYSATALMQIQITASGIQSMGVVSDSKFGSETEVRPQMEILTSQDFLTPIIEAQKLDGIWAKRFRSDHEKLSHQATLDHLRKILKIGWVPGTNIIGVTAASELPQEAADIANAVVDHYKAMRAQEQAEHDRGGVESLRTQIAQQQKVVDDKKVNLEKLRQTLGAIGPEPQNNDYWLPFRIAQREFEQQQALLDALNLRLKQVIADEPLEPSPVRIISRAFAPPE